VRVGSEELEVKGKTERKTFEKKPEKRDEKVKEEKKEVHRCDQCKWYDVSTQRDFHRDGIRKGLVEVRAVCRSPTARAKGHLVKNDSDRPCFEEGKYVKPEKPKKTKEKRTKENMTEKEAKEFEKNFVKENVVDVPEKSVRRKNGDVVILERKKGKTYVRPVSK